MFFATSKETALMFFNLVFYLQDNIQENVLKNNWNKFNKMSNHYESLLILTSVVWFDTFSEIDLTKSSIDVASALQAHGDNSFYVRFIGTFVDFIGNSRCMNIVSKNFLKTNLILFDFHFLLIAPYRKCISFSKTFLYSAIHDCFESQNENIDHFSLQQHQYTDENCQNGNDNDPHFPFLFI